MTTAKSTPAPAGLDVEQAAHRAWVKYVLDSLASTGVVPWAEGMELRAIYSEGYARGHADAAATDRAALARANGLLRRCARFTEGQGDSIALYNAIMDHLDGKTTPPTPSPSLSP